jgi:hypothetical protein
MAVSPPRNQRVILNSCLHLRPVLLCRKYHIFGSTFKIFPESKYCSVLYCHLPGLSHHYLSPGVWQMILNPTPRLFLTLEVGKQRSEHIFLLQTLHGIQLLSAISLPVASRPSHPGLGCPSSLIPFSHSAKPCGSVDFLGVLRYSTDLETLS